MLGRVDIGKQVLKLGSTVDGTSLGSLGSSPECNWWLDVGHELKENDLWFVFNSSICI